MKGKGGREERGSGGLCPNLGNGGQDEESQGISDFKAHSMG